jgi:hypothetical protein
MLSDMLRVADAASNTRPVADVTVLLVVQLEACAASGAHRMFRQ